MPKPPPRRLAVSIVGLLACGLVPDACAGTEVGLGYAEGIDGEPAHVLTLGYTTAQRHPWEFLAGYISQRDYATRAPVSDALVAVASRRLTWKGWFASGGIAWVSEDNDVLSGHAQFLTGAGWHGGAWTVSVRHLSNGDTNGRNRGETFLLLQYGF